MTLTKDNPHRKHRITCSISKELVDWLESIKGEGSRSKAIEKALKKGRQYM